MARTSQRFLVAAISAGAALLGAFVWHRYFREPPRTVQVIDTSGDIFSILEARLAQDVELEDVSSTYPPRLRREQLDEELTEKFYPQIKNKEFQFDPLLYFRRRGPREYWRRWEEHPDGGWTLSTNSLGMRETEEVLAEKPDLRVLVTGDSHTGGVVPNTASFTNVMEVLLAEKRGETVEALNAGAGGYNFYNYLGALEAHGGLEPDVFLFVVYGGNDFAGSMFLERYFNRRPPPEMGPYRHRTIHQEFGRAGEIISQEFSQVIYFLNNPDDERVVIDLAASVTAEIAQRCEEAGIRLACGYIPPPLVGQPELYREKADAYLETLGADRDALAVSDRIADAWMAFLDEREIPYFDARPAFRAADEIFYWETNSHINIVANRVVAEGLAPVVEAALVQ